MNPIAPILRAAVLAIYRATEYPQEYQNRAKRELLADDLTMRSMFDRVVLSPEDYTSPEMIEALGVAIIAAYLLRETL